MQRLKRIFVGVLFCVLCIGACLMAEEITLTTYYPAPYGAYEDLSAQEMDVDDGLIVGETYVDNKGSQPAPVNGMIVEGNVGIGTDDPETYELKVEGTIHAATGYSTDDATGVPLAGVTDTILNLVDNNGVEYDIVITNGIITDVITP